MTLSIIHRIHITYLTNSYIVCLSIPCQKKTQQLLIKFMQHNFTITLAVHVLVTKFWLIYSTIHYILGVYEAMYCSKNLLPTP